MEKGLRSNPVITGAFGWISLAFCWIIPPLIFIGFAFFFRQLDLAARAPSRILFWGTFMLSVTSALFIAKICAGHADYISMVHATGLSASFLLYALINTLLPGRFGKFVIILLWLAIQYIYVKFLPSASLIFLPSIASIPQEYLSWTSKTGYLGASFWILLANFLFYTAFLKQESIRWLHLPILVTVIVLPLIISFNMTDTGLNSLDVIDLYKYNASRHDEYSRVGELVSRTAAWISVLIVIFTLVKKKVQKI